MCSAFTDAARSSAGMRLTSDSEPNTTAVGTEYAAPPSNMSVPISFRPVCAAASTDNSSQEDRVLSKSGPAGATSGLEVKRNASRGRMYLRCGEVSGCHMPRQRSEIVRISETGLPCLLLQRSCGQEAWGFIRLSPASGGC